MKFTGEEYYQAATERMRQAREIHNSRASYALAMYCSGLAVECLLRAFRWEKNATFEGRHDLEDLLKASGLLQTHAERARRKGIPARRDRPNRDRFRAAISEVAALWHNNLRFASDSSLRAYLRRIGRVQGIKGDALKKNSADLLSSAQLILDQGVMLWISKRKSESR